MMLIVVQRHNLSLPLSKVILDESLLLICTAPPEHCRGVKTNGIWLPVPGGLRAAVTAKASNVNMSSRLFPRRPATRSLPAPISLSCVGGQTSVSNRQLDVRYVYLRYHILVILVFLILRCSWKMPYMRASLVGGQPGT